MSGSFDLLLGRVTFDIWEPYWPPHADIWPEVMSATKYVASRTRTSSEWQPTVFLGGDVPAHVADLKAGDGPDLHVFGSADLLQTLFRHDLVDALGCGSTRSHSERGNACSPTAPSRHDSR